MDYQIVWTEPAITDLEAIVRYLARRSQAGAESVREAILSHVEILTSFPLIGPAYSRDRSGRTREIVCRGYRIFYQVSEAGKRVEIMTVWHSSRQEPDLSN